jgi:hypothetical protein
VRVAVGLAERTAGDGTAARERKRETPECHLRADQIGEVSGVTGVKIRRRADTQTRRSRIRGVRVPRAARERASGDVFIHDPRRM